MKWITREHVKVDRVACPWLIRNHIDPSAEFLFVSASQVADTAIREGATSFDCEGDELGHHGRECSFEAFIRKYQLDRDPALALMAKIINGADTDNSLWNRPESAGLNAIADGFRSMGLKDDQAILEKEFPTYDALYAYCRKETGGA